MINDSAYAICHIFQQIPALLSETADIIHKLLFKQTFHRELVCGEKIAENGEEHS